MFQRNWILGARECKCVFFREPHIFQRNRSLGGQTIHVRLMPVPRIAYFVHDFVSQLWSCLARDLSLLSSVWDCWSLMTSLMSGGKRINYTPASVLAVALSLTGSGRRFSSFCTADNSKEWLQECVCVVVKRKLCWLRPSFTSGRTLG